ncbi:hypothetical protein BC937DRAFT_86974 [Endogone sp. FLAS-F59071]|nr:hypothetical protein BC937DRAFT_86974 [Endogone sp. FLAS-F59071]|eukprot:RUS23340.1 hypothetical protein BC937DRAFT_86974 [Endogone sp. FLAS-F59071]
MDVDIESQTGLISLDILAITNESRMAYGLRRQDYQSYRQYCMRRLHRLRQVLNFTHSKGKGFQKKEAPSDFTDSRHLHLMLYQTERAWSYAMELKRESTERNDPRKRYHLVKRLRKAAQYSEQLVKLCAPKGGKVDGRTALDVQAYASLMSGYLLFEEQSWQAALDKFVAARTIYENLASAGTPHQEALCNSAIDEIDPNIRFCAYRLRLGGASGTTSGARDAEELVTMLRKKGNVVGIDLLEAQLEDALAQTRQQRAESLTSITWRGRTVSLKNADLAVAILRAQEVTNELEERTSDTESQLELYDKVLEAYAEAEKVAKKAVKDDEAASAKVKSSKSSKATEEVNFLYTYVAYCMHARIVQRNLLLAESIRIRAESDGRPQDVVKLYDDILKSLDIIKELPIVQQDNVLEQEMEAKSSYFKAWRSVYVAAAYAALSKYAEAVTLFDRAQQHLTRARGSGRSNSVTAGNEEDPLSIKEPDLVALEKSIRGRKCKAHAAWYLEQDEDVNTIDVEKKFGAMRIDEKDIDELALVERLNTYPTNIPTLKSHSNIPRLIDFPPTFHPIPAKPLFFDIAFSHVEYPNSLLDRAGKKPPQTTGTSGAASRLSGMLGGWWGNR